MVSLETISIVLTGIGIIIALTYYGLQIRNQNRTRQAQLFMQMYHKYDDALMDSFGHIQRIEYEDYADFLEKYGPTSDDNMLPHFRRMAYFLEGMGVLVKEGLLSMRLVALTWAGTSRMFWDKLAPIIGEWREEINYPRLWSETEYLCKELIRYMDEHPELRT